MDHTKLKRKLSTYVTEGGYLRNVSDELLYEVLTAWEAWNGTAKEFYKAVGYLFSAKDGFPHREGEETKERRTLWI